MKAHVWYPLSKKISFMFCGKCGLINLKNKLTSYYMNKPCPGREEDE